MPTPTSHQGVEKVVKRFPGLRASDSLKVIFPGMSGQKGLEGGDVCTDNYQYQRGGFFYELLPNCLEDTKLWKCYKTFLHDTPV